MARGEVDAKSLFGAYMNLARVPTLEPEPDGSQPLYGKSLGIVNGSAWVTLWSYWFGRKHLPGVKLINVGNEAVQLNFMRAHLEGRPCPPPANVDLFVEYAQQLHTLFGVDAILITCSTMNRSAEPVRAAMDQYGVPVVQIDEPMMEAAVTAGGRVLVVATHGPTVENTQTLLRETATRQRVDVEFGGATVPQAFDLLGSGDIDGHNEAIASAIRAAQKEERYRCAVLAQLSMSVFTFSYPNPEEVFGIPVICSGDAGFVRVREVLEARA